MLISRDGLSHDVLWHISVYFTRIILAVSFIGMGKYFAKLIRILDSKNEWIVLIISITVSLLLYQYVPDISISFARTGNPFIFYPAACAGSMSVLLLCKKVITWKSGVLLFLGKNSLTIMALHMDIPIQIAWIIIGGTGISAVLNQRWASICAIGFELVLLTVMIFVINRYFSWLLHPTKRNCL